MTPEESMRTPHTRLAPVGDDGDGYTVSAGWISKKDDFIYVLNHTGHYFDNKHFNDNFMKVFRAWERVEVTDGDAVDLQTRILRERHDNAIVFKREVNDVKFTFAIDGTLDKIHADIHADDRAALPKMSAKRKRPDGPLARFLDDGSRESGTSPDPT